jgi:hypothetical protein
MTMYTQVSSVATHGHIPMMNEECRSATRSLAFFEDKRKSGGGHSMVCQQLGAHTSFAGANPVIATLLA